MEKIERSTYTYRTDEHKILIIVEDSGHGYKFYKKLLKSVYKDIDFYIESTHGFGGIYNTLEKSNLRKFTDCVLIFDSGVNRESMRSIQKQLRRYVMEHPALARKVTIFSPACFEQVLFSCTKLDNIINIKEGKKGAKEYYALKDIITGGKEEYDDLVGDIVNMSKAGTEESGYESLLEKLVTNTKYSYKHSGKMSQCWIANCCYNDTREKSCTLCTPEEIRTKVEYIATMSLAMGLLKIIDKILGFNFRHYRSEIIDPEIQITDEWICKYIHKLR